MAERYTDGGDSSQSRSEFLELTQFVESTFSSLKLDDDAKKSFVKMVADRLERRNYSAHTIVIRKGDTADTMCFIYRGSAAVYLDNPPEQLSSPGKIKSLARATHVMTSSQDFAPSVVEEAAPATLGMTKPVAVLEEKTYFGEAALIGADSEPVASGNTPTKAPVRNACVYARTDLDVYLLTQNALRECMKAHPVLRGFFHSERLAKEAENAKKAALRERAVKIISATFFLQICGNCATLTARPNMLLALVGNDAAAAAALQSVISSCGSVLEFIFGPCLGRLSDQYGRLPFLLIGPIGSLVCDGLVALHPSWATVVLGKVISGMTVTSFVTMSRGSLADVVQGEAMALANSKMAVYSGLGIIISPWIAARFLSDRMAYLFSACCSVINGLVLMLAFRETLPLSDRKPVNWLACNPFSFVKLFTHSKTMTMLVLAVGFQSLGEIRFAFDIGMIIWRSVHGLSSSRTGDFSALLGFGYVPSPSNISRQQHPYGEGIFAPDQWFSKVRIADTRSMEQVIAGQVGLTTIKKLGQKGHTTWCNLINFIANALWSVDTGQRGTIASQVIMSMV